MDMVYFEMDKDLRSVVRALMIYRENPCDRTGEMVKNVLDRYRFLANYGEFCEKEVKV